MGCSSSKDNEDLSGSIHGERDAVSGLSSEEFRPLKLRKITQVSPDSKAYEVSLLDPKAKLNAAVSYFVLVKGADDSMKPYTPTSASDQVGYFELVIKTYPGGKVSSFLNTLKVGDSIQVKGPIAKLKYTANSKKSLGMLAGGTGITPMLQVIREVLKNPADKAAISLVFANRTEKDILLKKEIDALAKKHSNFKVTYILSQPSDSWKGLKGHVNADTLALIAPPAEDVLIYVCGPPGFMDLISGNKTPDKQQGPLTGLLKEKGYTEDMVFKF